jgi:phenylalanyl-tRNA synthetase beta chain
VGRKEQGIDFFDVKGDVEACWRRCVPPSSLVPTRHAPWPLRARVLMNGKLIGHVGELHPQWRQSWDCPRRRCCSSWSWMPCCNAPVPQFKPVAKHQAVERDLAVVVAERVTHSEVMAAVESAVPASLLRSAVLFDVYRPRRSGLGKSRRRWRCGCRRKESGGALDLGQRRSLADRG